jgi:NAD(P)H-flavin reductase
MDYEIIDCIDAGTEYCPCHLAEVGECILCSQLNGKKFCDCTNWKGVCIYQEYVWNGYKAKNQRCNYLCEILNKELLEEKIALTTLKVPHKLAQDLIHPGSYVFVRDNTMSQFYDAPMSIMESDVEKDTIKIAIEVKGIKTKSIQNVNPGQGLLIRGPFWNGIFGLKNIYSLKNSTALVIARGIGQAPMIPVLRKLHANGNKIIAILDRAEYDELFINDYLYKYDCKEIYCSTIDKGELSKGLKDILDDLIKRENIGVIHCDGPDILTYKLIQYIKNSSINITSCNNSKMCCGEGVCGSCSARFKGHVVKRLCKVQTEPKNLFEGRRLI